MSNPNSRADLSGIPSDEQSFWATGPDRRPPDPPTIVYQTRRAPETWWWWATKAALGFWIGVFTLIVLGSCGLVIYAILTTG